MHRIRQAWKTLWQSDIRPTRTQWLASLVIGGFGSVLYAGLWFWVSPKLGFDVAFTGLAFLFIFGMAAAYFVHVNLKLSLHRSQSPHALAFMCVIGAAVSYALLVYGPFRVLSFVIDSPAFLGMPFAMIALLLAQRRPAQDDPMCSRCEYPYIIPNTPARCPECGSLWTVRGGTKLPKPTLHKPLAFLGFSMFLLPMVTQELTRRYPALVPWPTSFLVWRAQHERFDFRGTFKQLASRTLDPATTRTLAEFLLDSSKTDIGTSGDGMSWLEGLAVAGTLPADLIERYYAEMRTPVLKVSTPIQLNQPAAVLVGFQQRSFMTGGLKSFAVVQSVTITAPDGSVLASLPAPARALPEFEAIWSAPHTPAPVSFSSATPAILQNYPSLTFTPTSPGRYVVKASFWMVVRPAGAAATPWTPPFLDASDALIPRGDQVWMKKIELREEFDVPPN